MKLTRLDDENAVIHVRIREGWEEDVLVAGLDAFQARVRRWSDVRLPNREKIDPYLNLAEEVGELGRAVLKGRQKIRFTEEEIAQMKREEAADALLALLDFCAMEGFSLAEAARSVFEKKSNPAYDLERAATKRRHAASADVIDALSMSLLTMRRSGLAWDAAPVRVALKALAEANGSTWEKIVADVNSALDAERKSGGVGKPEDAP